MAPWGVLCSLGDLVEDIVVYIATMIARGTDTPASVRRRQGGSAANVAKHAALLGTSTTFIGQVGNDPTGAALVAVLVQAGVRVAAISRGQTGTIVVLVSPDGERSFITDRGSAPDLGALPDGCLDGVKYVHVPWYSLAAGPIAHTARQAIHEARSVGAGLSIDTSSVSLLRDVAANRRAITELEPDILFANAAEAAHLNLLSEPLAGVRLTVIKRGADAAILVDRKGRTVASHATAIDIPRLDSTGAGDAFAAGFLAAILHGDSDLAAAAAGHDCAAGHLIAQHNQYHP